MGVFSASRVCVMCVCVSALFFFSYLVRLYTEENSVSFTDQDYALSIRYIRKKKS